MTHTYIELEVSKAVYEEIRGKLLAAGYEHACTNGAIDMSCIALVEEKETDDDTHSRRS